MDNVAFKGFDSFLRRCMRDWDVPGVAVGVVKGNRIIYTKGYGSRDLKRGLPVTEDTLFGIASCTKAFTATVIGILVDEGKLEWDRPVRTYLPWFKMYDPVATERTTIRDILSHRTGLPGHGFVKKNPSMTRLELAKRLRYLEPSADFRSKHQYTSIMYGFAGLLVEAVTGKTWEQLVQERIFDPLGMTASKHLKDLPSDEMSVGYTIVGKRLVPALSVFPKGMDLAWITGPACGPSGSIISNVTDMCRWTIFQINKGKYGKNQVISEQSLKEIHTPQSVLLEWESKSRAMLDASYCMGWVVRGYRGYRVFMHGGNGFGFNAHVMFLPRERIGAVVLTNISNSPLNYTIPLNVFDRLLGLKQYPWNLRAKRFARKQEVESERAKDDYKPKRDTHLSLSLKDYAGDYYHPGYGHLTVEVEDGELKILFSRFTYTLRHYENDIFQMTKTKHYEWVPELKVTFHINKVGKVKSVSIPLVLEAPQIKVVFRKTKNRNYGNAER